MYVSRHSPSAPPRRFWRAQVLTRRGLCAGIGLLLAGCAAYDGNQALAKPIAAMPYSVKDGSVSLGADPHVETERQDTIFDADFSALAIVPIQVAVANEGSRVLRVGPDQFALSLPSGDTTAPRSGSEVAEILPPERSLGHYATGGVSMLGGLAGPIGALAGRVVGLLGTVMLSRYDAEAAEGRRDDYARKELPNLELRRGEFARGFLFFVLPHGTPPFEDATLTFSPPSDSGLTTMQLALKALHIVGVPAASHSKPLPP